LNAVMNAEPQLATLLRGYERIKELG